MPGPGGGARGGGGSRSGGFGGGGRSGGFGGSHGHHGHHGPVFFGGPRRYYGGGGCFSSILGAILLPLVFILFAVIFIVSSISTSISILSQGGVPIYDENKFQDYANSQYAAEFGEGEAYEDYLLLVFLVEEEYYDYAYIAWLGDHIDGDISQLFGNEQTALGHTIDDCVNQNSYKYSLDSNLAQVMDTMSTIVKARGLESSYNCSEEHSDISSHLTNKTSLELTESTVNRALEDFTESTGIPVVIVVDDIEDVFEKGIPSDAYIPLIISAVLVFIAIMLIISLVKTRKAAKDFKNSNGNYDRYNQNSDDNNY